MQGDVIFSSGYQYWYAIQRRDVSVICFDGNECTSTSPFDNELSVVASEVTKISMRDQIRHYPMVCPVDVGGFVPGMVLQP